MEKIFYHKSFNYLFGHLWEVELTYRYITAFKFTLRSQQPDIVPIICHPVSLTPVANLPPVSTTLVKLMANLPPVHGKAVEWYSRRIVPCMEMGPRTNIIQC